MKTIWINCVTPEGLHYQESMKVRSRKKKRVDLDGIIMAAATAATMIMTAVLVYVTVPMAWAVWGMMG